MSAPDLRAAWIALWRRLGAIGDAGSVWAELRSRYSEPGRTYHTLTHIEQRLSELADAPEGAANPDAIECALWFHDAVYDTKCKDNEERSAAFAREVIRVAGLSDSFGGLVTDLILATRHTSPPVSPGEQLLADIDLAILGQSESRFDQYEREIRFEYSWVPEDVFAAGRVAVLSSIIERPRIYSTEFFFGKYEKAARENLARSISQLTRA
jgi:predicted metal-dependent HD superfamily phosphohydrolase